MLRDLRYAFRTLRRSPGFVAVAVLSLGLGLGLTTTMFGLLDAVRHPYSAMTRANDLYDMYWRYYVRNARITGFDMYRQVRDNTSAFDVFLPVAWFQESITIGEDRRQGSASRVPPRFFGIVGVQPELGRTFTTADETEDVAVISHTLWRRGFRGRRSLTGLHLTLGTRTYAVIGVMPRGMSYPFGASAWIPLPASVERSGDGIGFVRPLVRLKAGTSPEAAKAQLAALAKRLDAIYQVERNPFQIVMSRVDKNTDQLRLRDIHYAMLGGSIFVLLIACANLANLMLARGMNARRELALRLAVGATRGAVVRQMFVECAIVALLGGLTGIVLAWWGQDILSSRIPRELEWVGILEPQLSWRVFAIAAAAVTVSSILFGLIPAIRVVSGVSLDEPLKEGSANTTQRVRHRYSSLVVVEVALALSLMMGAGLLAKVVHLLSVQDYAFPARRIVRDFVFTTGDTTKHQDLDHVLADFLVKRADLIARVMRIPGAAGAAFEGSSSNPGGGITAEMSDSVRLFTRIGYPVVTAGYLRAMGIPLLEGRDFLEGDESGQGVAILNRTAARLLYPHGNAVGRMVKLGAPGSDAPWVPIVGIAQGLEMRRQFTNEWGSDPQIWVARSPRAGRKGMMWSSATLIARSGRENPQFPILVERAVREAGWRDMAGGVQAYLAVEQSEIRTRGFLARLFATMASFALGLAAVGLYGVLAYAVTRRMREFGVRIAVGAQARDIVRIVAHDSTVMVLAGTGVGAFLALGTSYIFESYLTGVYPTDAWTLVLCEMVLFVAATVASFAPAVRAMRADPLEILRAI